MRNIAILGSTGSIGRQTLQVIDNFPEEMRVVALAAGGNVELLADQARLYQPEVLALADTGKFFQLKSLLPGFSGEIIAGAEAIVAAAAWPRADLVVAAVSGIAGLLPVIAAIEAGKDIAFANKEVLVAAGSLVIPLVAAKGINFLPVDSEHSAIFQCLEDGQRGVESLILTASGGPFYNWPMENIAKATRDQALKHPTWNMGPKISIDSASLANKGLEVIEAHWLFGRSYDTIEVVIHPESVIHSLVRYVDGSLLAHLGKSDMRIPIQYALTYPRRRANSWPRLDLAALGKLTFARPDLKRFPCLGLAYEAGRAGGLFPTVFNAANEELAAAFLAEKISFGQIPQKIEKALTKAENKQHPTLEDILTTDHETREFIAYHK